MVAWNRGSAGRVGCRGGDQSKDLGSVTCCKHAVRRNDGTDSGETMAVSRPPTRHGREESDVNYQSVRSDAKRRPVPDRKIEGRIKEMTDWDEDDDADEDEDEDDLVVSSWL